MSCQSKLTSRLALFAHEDSGNVAITFGLLSIVMMSMIGAAIDISRATHTQSKLQLATDAAAVAAARAWDRTDSTRREAAQKYFQNNLEGYFQSSASVTVDTNSARTIVTATATVPTTFMGLMGVEEMTVSARSEASNTGKALELSMMLDVTGSMSGQPIIDLRNAAMDLLDIVLPPGMTNTRVALVPFSDRVNVGAYFDDFTGTAVLDRGASSSSRWLSRCVYERAITQTENADFVGTSNERSKITSLGEETPSQMPFRAIYTSNSNRSCSPNQAIVPLTGASERQTKLNPVIQGLTAGGATSGHIGTAWAWYMLSPNWASVWPAASTPTPYNQEDTIKAAVLMTDGVYTEHAGKNANCNGNDTCIRAVNDALYLCQQMRNRGIQVYTIGFNITAGTVAETTLKQCAGNDPTRYFFPYNGNALRAAFSDIGRQLSAAKAGLIITK